MEEFYILERGWMEETKSGIIFLDSAALQQRITKYSSLNVSSTEISSSTSASAIHLRKQLLAEGPWQGVATSACQPYSRLAEADVSRCF